MIVFRRKQKQTRALIPLGYFIEVMKTVARMNKGQFEMIVVVHWKRPFCCGEMPDI
jgi:hypothetical protein